MTKIPDLSSVTPDPDNDEIVLNDASDTTDSASGTTKRATFAAAVAEYAGHINLKDASHSGAPGDVWDAGNALTYVPVADERSIGLANGVVMSNVTVANTITETTVYTETVSANELYKGSKWHVKLSGVFSTANANDTFTGRLKIGGTLIHSFTIDSGNVSNQFWRAEFFFTVRSVGASGSVIASAEVSTGGTDHSSASTATDTIDTTAQQDITLTIQWDNADPGDTLTITQGHTEILGVKQA